MTQNGFQQHLVDAITSVCRSGSAMGGILLTKSSRSSFFRAGKSPVSGSYLEERLPKGHDVSERLVQVWHAVYASPDAGVSDADLLARLAAGKDDTAFELLIRRHADLVWRVCKRVARDQHTAEDAFQATFLALLRRAAFVRGASAVGFLHQVAFRAALKAKPRDTVSPLPEDVASQTPEPDQVAAASELGRLLHAELNLLPDRYRVPLVLCYLNGFTQAEAAARLGCPVGTVSAQLSRGCDRLRARLMRRGIVLPASGVAGMFVTTVEAVSQSLIQITASVRTGVPVPAVASLARKVLISMRYAHIKTFLLPIFATIIAFGGVAWSVGQTPKPPVPKQALAVPPAPKPPKDFNILMIRLGEMKPKMGQDEWALVIRDLILLGADAVPDLIQALDKADDVYTLRCLAFVARGIGDKRVIPALIRAFPKTCESGSSDCAFIAKDPELLAFMQKHDTRKGDGGTHYDFGRAITEVRLTLQKMTGVKHGEDELNFAHLGGSARQQYLQRSQFHRCADRWAKWWEGHWKELISDERYSRVDLPALAVVPATSAGEFPHGPKAKITGWVSGGYLQSVHNPKAKQVFLDLDSGREAALPERLRSAVGQPERIDDIAAWAAAEGLDLMCTEYLIPGDEKPHYVLRGLGLATWRFAGDRREELKTDLLRKDPLEGGTRVDGLLVRFNTQLGRYDPADTSTYLFHTREGGCGALFVGVEVHDNSMQNGFFPSPINIDLNPVGFQKGRRLAYTLISNAD